MSNEVETPILKLRKDLIAPIVLIVGDPARADYVSTLLENPSSIVKIREYHIYTGLHKGERVTVASHGVGGPGTLVLLEELAAVGVKVIIRAGTCGSFVEELSPGSFVIVTGAVREDGASEYLIPLSYPAVSHHETVISLINSLEQYPNEKLLYKVGLCHSTAVLYPGPLGNKNELWRAALVTAQDMEVSTVLVFGCLKGIKTGAILTVDNYLFKTDMSSGGDYNPYTGKVKEGSKLMVELALNALISFK